MSKHTPGPWELRITNRDMLIGIEFKNPLKATSIASIHGCSKQDVANARLIASAPELLEACKESFACVQVILDYIIKLESPEAPFSKLKSQLQQAIAKAEGR